MSFSSIFSKVYIYIVVFSILRNDIKRYENGGLKNADIGNKVNSLQNSRVKRLTIIAFMSEKSLLCIS